jgi:hypothetical protein
VRTYGTSRQRVFLTFAAGDLSRVRPLTARLQAGGGIVLDEGLSSEPFATTRGDIVRRSLTARLRRCGSALCLYGAATLDDDWVRWALASALDLRIPLLGAPLPGAATSESERLLTDLGVELVHLSGREIAARTEAFAGERRRAAIDAASLAEALYLMRHPLR